MPKTSRLAKIDERLSAPAVKCKLCHLLTALAVEYPEDAAHARWMLQQPVNVKGHKHIADALAGVDVLVSPSTVGACRAGGHQL